MAQPYQFRAWRNGLLAAVLLTAITAGGEEAHETIRALSLADCIRIGLEHNLDVKIARFNPEIQQHNLNADYGVYEPVFSFAGARESSQSPGGLDAQNRPYKGTTSSGDTFTSGLTGILPTGLGFTLGGDLSGSKGVSASAPFESADGVASIQAIQPVLRNFWIDNARYTIQVGKKQLKESELALRNQIMTTVTSIELAYDNLIQAREQVKIENQALQLAQQLVSDNRLRVRAGDMAPQDQKEGESQLMASQTDLRDAQQALVVQEYGLKNLLSDNFSEWAGVILEPSETLLAVPCDFNLQQSWKVGLSQRPDLLQAKTDLERQGIVLKYLHNQIFPELDLVGSYSFAGSGVVYQDALGGIREGNSPSWSLGAQLSIPLMGNRTARENYRANKALRDQALAQLKQLEQTIMLQIALAIEAAKARLADVDTTRQSRVFAEEALQAEQKKLDTGKSDSFHVLQFQLNLTLARTVELSAVTQYNQALAQLALNEGTTLERHKLDLRIR
jgi:outer membrane protein TolC